MPEQSEVIVGLDIGTTKIAAVVGEISHEGMCILGVGTHVSKGLRKGVVVNIDSTVNSIKEAIEEAEHMSGCEITTVYAGIAGGHISSMNSDGVVAIKDGEVREQDVLRVIDSAKAVSIPLDREILHVLPQEYIIDGQDGVKEPVGMSGVRLEAKVHIVTAAVTSAQNIVKCCNRCGLNVADIVLEPLASALATLQEDEKELGVALIDIGGGTTDIALFVDGAVVHTSVLAVGGNHLTSDIAVGLRTPRAEAEKIKQRWGYALAEMLDESDAVPVPSTGGRRAREVNRQALAGFIEPRAEEIFMLAHHEITKAGFGDLLGSGAVITGGTTIMPGMVELGESILGMPVRLGLPMEVGGLVEVVRNPKFATGVGLIKYGAENNDITHFRALHREERLYRRMKRRMRDWWHEIF